SADRKSTDLSGVDYLADFGLGRLDDWSFSGDDHLLVRRGNLQGDIDGSGLADGQHDAFAHGCSETFEGSSQFIVARRDVRENIVARIVRGRRVRTICVGFDQSDGGTFDGATAFVEDGTAQLREGGTRLRISRAGICEEKCKCQN